MKNFEKWEKEILDITQENQDVALLHNKPVSCDSIKCMDCCLSWDKTKDQRTCGIKRMEWLYSEYVEKLKLTKRERKFCELFEGKGYYIARDKNGECYGFTCKPNKNQKEEQWTNSEHYGIKGYWFNVNGVLKYADIKFDFIKWEDEEPWAIDDLLKLEVIDN